MRPSWDTYFLNIAEAVSLRADCTRRKVGAVLVDSNNRIISTGYNGAPPGAAGCASDGACPRGQSDVPGYTEGNHDYSDCIAVHAEVNAIAIRSYVAPGTTIYVTHEPCNDCKVYIKNAGVSRVVYPG
jgi:dCMP deaminase